jgi:hypothetical protein
MDSKKGATFIIDVVGTLEKEGKGGSSHSELFQWKNW